MTSNDCPIYWLLLKPWDLFGPYSMAVTASTINPEYLYELDASTWISADFRSRSFQSTMDICGFPFQISFLQRCWVVFKLTSTMVVGQLDSWAFIIQAIPAIVVVTIVVVAIIILAVLVIASPFGQPLFVHLTADLSEPLPNSHYSNLRILTLFLGVYAKQL